MTHERRTGGRRISRKFTGYGERRTGHPIATAKRVTAAMTFVMRAMVTTGQVAARVRGQVRFVGVDDVAEATRIASCAPVQLSFGVVKARGVRSCR
ncbi:hypothetical protein [Lysobacter sp. yr284]|uniref:hypothetical protein n=1 Tax=Lysobacter sp. yr284 TaxID=1761791 RepID=UPI0011136DF7|nr:hypothetical protein [Lysobacter sp. yr284]